MTVPRPFLRPLRKFFQGPASARNALRAIVAVTLATTLVGGVLAWTFDRKDFPTFGDALWWSLQTVTTVGYGDVTPRSAVGRLIGGVVLLYAVAFLAILTASVTATFIEKARHERGLDEAERDLGAVMERLDDIASRLDRLERDPRRTGG